jgi:hypothetical protein
MLTVKESFLKGPTRARFNAAWIHPAAGVPAAPPDTDTLDTEPLEPNVIVARDDSVCPATHARAASRTDPIAP